MLQQLLDPYNRSLSYNGIDGQRVATRLDAISKIGLTQDNGCTRIAFSKEEQQAKELVISWMKEAGLSPRQDGVGNVIAQLQGKSSERIVMSGSHVDSVPNGGHFDGPLGVIAALEVVEAWRETGFIPDKTYEIVIFSDEEGARFHSGLTGSQVMTGQWTLEDKLALKDAEGNSFESVLAENNLSFDSLRDAEREFSEVDAFVEVHIEQGKRLEKQDLPVGIVQGIAGPSWLNIVFTGLAGHAGNTPMNDRSDALIAASLFISAIEALPPKFSETAVATVGKLAVKPNGVNVIPGEVTLTVDIRDIEKESRDQLRDAVIELANAVATDRNIRVTTEQVMYVPPVKVKQDMQAKAERAVKMASLIPYFLPSGAGHDAMMIGRKTNVAMLFTRSKDGVSHNPAEWSTLDDCVQTIHVLKNMLEELCSVGTDSLN